MPTRTSTRKGSGTGARPRPHKARPAKPARKPKTRAKSTPTPDKPAGQGLSWHQWCPLVGVGLSCRKPRVLDLYNQGTKPAEARKLLAKPVKKVTATKAKTKKEHAHAPEFDRIAKVLHFVKTRCGGENVRANLNGQFGADLIAQLTEQGLLIQLHGSKVVGEMDVTGEGVRWLKKHTIDSPEGPQTVEQMRAKFTAQAKGAPVEKLREVVAVADLGPHADAFQALRREVAQAELDRRTPKMPYHPLSNLLPMMSQAERSALRDSLRDHGQIEEIVRLDGQILDGRNRYEELIYLGIEPRFRDFDPARDGKSPLDYVYAKAVHRNLNDGQKACAAVNFEEQFALVTAPRGQSNLKQNKGKPWALGTVLRVSGSDVRVESYRGPNVTLAEGSGTGKRTWTMPVEDVLKVADGAGREVAPVRTGRARDHAANLFGISGRYVQDAKLVKEKAPELFAQVFNGDKPLTHAKAEVRRRERSAHLEKKAEQHAAAKITGKDLWEIVTGDCLKEFPKQPRGKFRLLICDPQYNIGYDYGQGKAGDDLSDKDYLGFSEKWITEAAELLAPDGSLWVIISDEYAAELAMILKDAGLHMRAWVKWFESFGVNCANCFNRTSRHLLYFTKDVERFVFNPDAFKRSSDRQAKYADPRANPAGKIWDDVWGINPPIPRLTDTAAERVPGIPTQLPLKLITPIVLGCSEPGDLVGDLFCGSGTTCVAAVTHGRRFFGTEINKDFAELSHKRVKAALSELASPQPEGK